MNARRTIAPALRPLAAVLLLTGGGLCIAAWLWNGTEAIGSTVRSISLVRLLGGLGIALATPLVNLAVYRALLRRLLPGRPPSREVAASYLRAQLVRHIPGRVWSALYLSRQLSSSIPERLNWVANIEQFAAASANTVGIAAAAWVWRWQSRWAAGVIGAATPLAVYGGLAGGWLHRLSQRIPRRAADGGPAPTASVRARASLHAVALIEFDWILFLALWAILLPSPYVATDCLVLAICYAAAWTAGVLAFVVPGGLIVREASFVWLGRSLGYDAGALVVLSVAVRLLFTAADLLAGAAGILLQARAAARANADSSCSA